MNSITRTASRHAPSRRRAGRPQRSEGRQSLSSDERLLALQPTALWKSFWGEPLSFWFLNAYFMVEYVRPQQVWRGIDVFPWGQTTLLLTSIAYLLEGVRTRKLNLLDGLLLVYTAILFLSSVGAYQPAASFKNFSLFFNWLLLFFLVTHIVTTPRRLLLFWGTFMLWSLKMSQFGTRTFIARGGAFASWGATGAPGWFHNSGEFAIQMCIFLPMSLLLAFGLKKNLTRWKFYGLLALLPGTAFISLIASSSRGGQLGAAVVILFIIAQSKHRVRGLVSAGLVMGLLWLIMPPQQKQRFQEMGQDKNSVARLTYWKDGIEILNEHPTLGIGYKNWLPYYRRYYNPTGELPHNIFVEAGSELGYTGLLAFIALILGTFALNRRTRRLASAVPVWGDLLRNAGFGLDAALVGFMATGFFVTVLYYPFFWVNLAFTVATYETTRRAANRARARRRRVRMKTFRAANPTPVAQGARTRNGGVDWAAR